MQQVVIVGAGLGGLRAAEALRASGFTGGITIVGDETHAPYTRPPLSKEALSGGIDSVTLDFPIGEDLSDVQWRLGVAATSVDFDRNRITLSDGESLHFDGLVIATGIRPRRLPVPGPDAGRFALRTIDDAKALRTHLTPGARVVIIGSGFIGCEVAATARGLGCEVDVVALDEEPMLRPLGPELGAALRKRHEAEGVRFHLGRTVERFTGTDAVDGVALDDGTHLPADVVVEAVGSQPNTEWLQGTDLDLTDGVLVDANMRAANAPVPTVAVGDIARHPNTRFRTPPKRIEHWNMPTETGRRAGATLAGMLAGAEVTDETFDVLPSFWSDQYDVALQSFGMPDIAERSEVVDGDLGGPCIVEYWSGSDLVGVVGVNRTRDLAPYRKRLRRSD